MNKVVCRTLRGFCPTASLWCPVQGTSSVSVVSSLICYFPLQSPAVQHTAAAALTAVPHHLSIPSQGLLALWNPSQRVVFFSWCLCCWNHDYNPLKNGWFSAFVIAESGLDTEIVKVWKSKGSFKDRHFPLMFSFRQILFCFTYAFKRNEGRNSFNWVAVTSQRIL